MGKAASAMDRVSGRAVSFTIARCSPRAGGKIGITFTSRLWYFEQPLSSRVARQMLEPLTYSLPYRCLDGQNRQAMLASFRGEEQINACFSSRPNRKHRKLRAIK
jgi:hypothetical protein